ncbi:MAG TPA: hypothetical protein VF244_09230 [Acidimicrobiales bacterium]
MIALNPEFRLVPWPSTLTEYCDPLGRYAETYWLPHLFPTAYALGRRLVTLTAQQQASGERVPVSSAVLAQALGLEPHYSAQVFVRALDKLRAYGFVRARGSANLAVRLVWPRLASSKLAVLPVEMQRAEPEHWAIAQQGGVVEFAPL